MEASIDYYCSVESERWVRDIFVECGVAPQDAALAAGILVRTSLRGIDTHGIARLPAYAEQLRQGVMRAAARPWLSSGHGFLHCDGDGGLGQLAAWTAMDAAIRQAQLTGIIAGTIGNAGHMGALGTYTLQASEQGLIAFMCQRTPPIMALPGATGRAIGNNPLAFSCPVPDSEPLVFDMASSAAARGKVLAAVRQGTGAIPSGWAIDSAGEHTTDPAAALAGAMLPMGGPKGIGLAMLVECLAGGLAAMEPGGQICAPELPGGSAKASAFFFVINPDYACERELFDRNVGEWIGHYLNSSGPAARYPGQRQASCENERRARGIPIDPALVEELCKLGALNGKRHTSTVLSTGSNREMMLSTPLGSGVQSASLAAQFQGRKSST